MFAQLDAFSAQLERKNQDIAIIDRTINESFANIGHRMLVKGYLEDGDIGIAAQDAGIPYEEAEQIIDHAGLVLEGKLHRSLDHLRVLYRNFQ